MPFYLSHEQDAHDHIPELPDYHLEAEQDDYNQIPELQVCLAEALYDIALIPMDPTALDERDLVRLRGQIVSNLERAWAITGSSKDELAAMMLQISHVADAGKTPRNR